jgi:enamine deaminase RidA (YjgF/YER057c/UK114 family)
MSDTCGRKIRTLADGQIQTIQEGEATMEKDRLGDSIQVGDVSRISGQVGIGHEIVQSQTVGASRPEVSRDELEEWIRKVEELKARVEENAPNDRKADALARVDELQRAVTDPKPKLSTMEYVRDWFEEHLPALAGSVTGLVVHPIVGKLVEAAGDGLAAEFRRRFGGKPG